MIEEPEFSTDEEYLKDLCGNLHDLIECCMGAYSGGNKSIQKKVKE